MVRDAWPGRRTVLIGMGAVGASTLTPCLPVRAEDEPVPMPVPGERFVPRNDTAPSQRAVLFEEDSAVPNGRQFAGSVAWSVGRERVGSDLSRPTETVLRAKVVIPDRDFGLQWSMRRNTDKSLPATLTLDIVFTLKPDFPHGGIRDVPGMLMKAVRDVRARAARGLAVKVSAGHFLIGLSNRRGDRAANMQLLKERDWFDVPIVYEDGRRAILSFEKGEAGRARILGVRRSTRDGTAAKWLAGRR